jgi:GNAT superfamily N-acetyltransferase
MYVEEKFRGKKLGEKLIESFKKLAKDKGSNRIQVGAISQNVNAVNFYKKMGFGEFETVLEENI